MFFLTNCREPILYFLCRDTSPNFTVRNVLCHYSSSRYYHPFADSDTAHDCSTMPYPYIIFNNRYAIVPSLTIPDKFTHSIKLMIISSDKTNTSGYQDIIFKYDIRSDIAIFSKLDVMTNTYFHASGKSSVSHNSHETIVFHPWIFQMK